MTISIREMMTKKLVTIEETCSIRDSAKKMMDNNVSSLVVVDGEGRLQGIVTERDIVRKACVKDVRTSEVTNKEIMSPNLIFVQSNSSASEAVDLMVQNNIRHLLVIDKENIEKPVGMITPLDLREEEYSDKGLMDAIEELSMYYR